MTRPALRHAALLFLLLTAACSHRSPPIDPDVALGRKYVDDAAFRRQVLEQSLVNPDNDYSKLRLAQYREDRWGALPEWNPPVQLAGRGESGAFRSIEVESVPWERGALVALGKEAFLRYPTQLQDALRVGLEHPDRYGLWKSGESIGGVVREQMKVGSPRLAMTCSTCHAMADADGHLIAGRPNARLNLAAMFDGAFGPSNPSAEWGPGRVDLTSDGIDNPVAISDLRPVRSEKYLHHDATIRNGLIELTIRIETLIISTNNRTFRPPRKMVFGLALYLWDMNPKAVAQVDESSNRGGEVFKKECARCHSPPDYAGDRMTLAKVGTNPSVGVSPDRTTGSYRIPSLRGVGDRAPLLASGEAVSLEALLDPARPAPGHNYGLELTAGSRRDLIAFLRTLE